ncbi:MAG: type II secretion system protein [Desulfobacteraceae bacterium]|nr:type II secretion system protein [Desulfobacteraceae bacterium]
MPYQNFIYRQFSLLGCRKGFTLIEIIAVLMILGILSAVAVSRFTDTGAELAGQTETVKGYLRFAQARAMSSGRPDEIWGIRFSRGSNCCFFFHCTGTCNPTVGSGQGKVVIPGSDPDGKLNIPFSSGIALKSMTMGTIVFDRLGRPYGYDGGPCGVPLDEDKLLKANASITFSHPSGATQSLIITPETGYIP